MNFEDLTAEEQAVLADYVRILRAWCGEQARMNNHGEALNSAFAQVQAILAQLDDADPVADGSGLDGAMTLTKAEIVSITANMQGLLASYNTAGLRQVFAKAAGPINLIG